VPEKAKSRFEGMASLDVPLRMVRSATLENNLDLKVALVDPSITSQGLRAEEAKFEAVFRPSIGYREDDNPTFNTTSSNQQNLGHVGAGVDIPLRTGGRVSVDFTESKTDTPNPFVTFPTAYESAVTFSMSQPLLRNAGRDANTYSIRIASYNQQISETRTKLEVIRQLAAADRAYWRLYAVRRELEVRQREYELAQNQLAKAQRRVDAGDAPEVEVIRAQSGVAEQLDAIIIAENSILNQQRELKRIINISGLEMETKIALVTTTEPTPINYVFDAPALADLAVANRMEMLELELQLAADLSTIDFQKNQALPLFTLDYEYSVGGLASTFSENNAVLGRHHFDSWAINLTGSIPIGNEAAKAHVQQAILTRLQRLSTREARRLAIRQEVLNAIDGVEAGWQLILAARQSTITAARTFEAEQRQFDVGARTSTDVLDAATKLADAQLSEIRALTEYQVALVDLSFATGTLLGSAKVDWFPSDAHDSNASNIIASPAGAPGTPASTPTGAPIVQPPQPQQ
jgi:outer membrane protein TolC